MPALVGDARETVVRTMKAIHVPGITERKVPKALGWEAKRNQPGLRPTHDQLSEPRQWLTSCAARRLRERLVPDIAPALCLFLVGSRHAEC